MKMSQEIGELTEKLKEEDRTHKRETIVALIAAMGIAASVYLIPRDYRPEESLFANIKRNIAEVATNVATNMGSSRMIIRRGVDKNYSIEYNPETNVVRLVPYQKKVQSGN